MSLRFQIPVIQANEVESGGEDPFQNMPYEIIMTYLLPLDPESVLNACSTSKILREICQTEYFWKIKSQKDFDLPENFELPEGGAWKNYYFNQLSPEREFKQLIGANSPSSAKELALLQRENPDFDQNKMLLFVLEQYSPEFKELVEEMIENINEMEREVGLNISCALSAIDDDLFKSYLHSFWTYHTSEEDDVEVAKCAIFGGNINHIRRIYNLYLNLHGVGVYGRMNPKASPVRFVTYARSLNKSPREIRDIVRAITETYDSYARLIFRRR